MEWILYALVFYQGYIAVYTSNFGQAVGSLIGYLYVLREHEAGTPTQEEIENFIMPKSHNRGELIRLLILPVLIVGFVISIKAGFICLGLLIIATVLARVFLPRNPKFYIRNLSKDLSRRINLPKNNYDKQNQPALMQTKYLIDDYLKHELYPPNL